MTPIVTTLQASSPTRGRVRGVAPSGGGYVAPDWEILRDFNSGTVGTAANGTADGFSGEATQSLYTTEQVFEGGQACKLQRRNVDGPGFGEYGGIINLTNAAANGDVVWFDMMFRLTTQESLDEMRVASKFVRLSTKTAVNGNGGYNDLYWSSGIRSAFQYQAIKEGVWQWSAMGTWGTVQPETWHRISIRFGMGNVAVSSGGSGSLRVWLDGVQLTNDLTFPTLVNATDIADAVYIATQYDHPEYQLEFSWYVDRIRVAKNGVPTWALDLEWVS
jgi:hypothetical protein